jgi:hypothetical protein
VDLVPQGGEQETSAAYQAARAVWEAECGNAAESKRDATAALALSKGRDVEYAAGLALALSGDSSRSQPLADDLEKRFPQDTFVKFTYVPVLRALAALEHSKPADSVERLQIALRYELAGNGLNFSHLYLGGLHSAYVRFRRFSIIAASWARIPLAYWRTCNSAEPSLCRETRPKRRLPITLFSHFGKTRTPTFRS